MVTSIVYTTVFTALDDVDYVIIIFISKVTWY